VVIGTERLGESSVDARTAELTPLEAGFDVLGRRPAALGARQAAFQLVVGQVVDVSLQIGGVDRFQGGKVRRDLFRHRRAENAREPDRGKRQDEISPADAHGDGWGVKTGGTCGGVRPNHTKD